jgi:hypothetical protein
MGKKKVAEFAGKLLSDPIFLSHIAEVLAYMYSLRILLVML